MLLGENKAVIWRISVGILLVLLGVFHILFGITNFGFVEGRHDLNVLAEAVGATIAGIALLWTAVQFIRRTNPWPTLLIAGGLFASTMVISIVTGASDPPMLLVSLIAPVVAVVGLAQSSRGRDEHADSSRKQ